LDIIISNTSGKPIYEQITAQIKAMILAGDLMEGQSLPSMRLLAKELRISVITTKRAYEDLERDGFIETVPGKGSFISHQNASLVREEHLRQAQEFLEQAVSVARSGAISLTELIEMLQLIYEGE
jgi:GntR family transcriptional regulator